MGEVSVDVYVRIEVVRSAFGRIIGEVQDVQRRDGTAVVPVTVREQLAYRNLAYIMVGELVEVALDMSRCQRTAAPCEERVDVVPCQQTAVESAVEGRLVRMLREVGRYAGDDPRCRLAYVDGRLRPFEVVQIGGVVLCSFALSGQKLCKLGGECDVGRLTDVQQRNLVEHIRQPLAFLLPVDVQSPDGVVERFCPHVHLGCQRLFGQVHERTADLEVFGEVVFPVHADHCLAFLLVGTLAFQGDIDGCSGVNDALIEDGYLPGTVIDTVVRAFIQGHTACRHDHRSLWYVIGPEGNDIRRRTPVLPCEHELVFFSNLLGDGLCGVVKLFEDILVCNGGGDASVSQGFP